MRAARAFDLPPPVLPIELVMVVEAPAASRTSVRKDFLPVHAYDAAAGVCIAVHRSAPRPYLRSAGILWRARYAGCRFAAALRISFRRRPTISSFPTLSGLPIVSSYGLLFIRAASIRSWRPSRSPAHCGPRSPLPPLKQTRSNPILL